MVSQFKLCTSYSALLLMYFEEANLAGANKVYRFTHVDEFPKATVYLNTVFNSLKCFTKVSQSYKLITPKSKHLDLTQWPQTTQTNL